MTRTTRMIAVFALAISAFNGNAQTAKVLRIAMAACGPAGALFRVDLVRKANLPPVRADRAVVYVIGNAVHFGLGPGAPILRVGVDGTWVGAVKGSDRPSYAAIPLRPGVHHFCVQWQGPGDATSVALNELSLRDGNSYWLVAEGINPSGILPPVLTLDTVNSDEGKLLVAAGRQALARKKTAAKP
ncbi:MAG: hypothetical protein ACLGSD_15185 [Acidobacteriota bacterium]